MTASKRVDPIPVLGFSVEIGGQISGWFTECSGITIEREVKTQPEGGVNDYVHQLPGRIKRANITLKHGLAGNELWQWFKKGLTDGQVERRNVSVVLYDVDLTELNRWDLVDTYPAKWSGSNFNSSNNEAVVETLELAQDNSPSSGGAAAVQRQAVEPEPSETSAPAQSVDLPALAKRVYTLLKQELKIEQERLGRY